MWNRPQRVRLRTISVKTQCRVSWEGMTGTGAVRHCGSCKSNVYNLSEMNDEEVEALLARSEDVCVRYYCRPDGTLVRTPCADKPRRAGATAVAGVAMSLATTTAFIGIDAAVDTPEVAMQAEGERVLVAMGGIKLKPMTPERRRQLAERRREREQASDALVSLAPSSVTLSIAPSAATIGVVPTRSTPPRGLIYGVLAMLAAPLVWLARRRWTPGEPR